MRTTSSKTVTTVRHVARAFGRNRENPPSLGDLRKFVAEAEGLPDDLSVRIEPSTLDEGGRRTVTLSVTHRHPEHPPLAPERP